MPFLRYVVFVGGALVAMLFLADWVWPSAVPAPVPRPAKQAAVESPFEQTIRIHSTRRWPEKIEFDTTIPTIVPPPPAPIVASAPAPAPVVASSSPLDARAEIKPAVQPAPAPKRQARVHRRNPRPADSTWAYANPMAPSWGPRW